MIKNFDADVIDILLLGDLMKPMENVYGQAWIKYNTGEQIKIWCGEKWGHWLCWSCYLELFKKKDRLLYYSKYKKEFHKRWRKPINLKELLGGINHSLGYSGHKTPKAMFHNVCSKAMEKGISIITLLNRREVRWAER